MARAFDGETTELRWETKSSRALGSSKENALAA